MRHDQFIREADLARLTGVSRQAINQSLDGNRYAYVIDKNGRKRIQRASAIARHPQLIDAQIALAIADARLTNQVPRLIAFLIAELGAEAFCTAIHVLQPSNQE